MSEEKYTPGPWNLRPECAYGWDIKTEDELWIADAKNDHMSCGGRPESGFPSNKEGLANARLIAAAPDMLESLQECIEGYRANHIETGVLNKAIAAIAKATQS